MRKDFIRQDRWSICLWKKFSCKVLRRKKYSRLLDNVFWPRLRFFTILVEIRIVKWAWDVDSIFHRVYKYFLRMYILLWSSSGRVDCEPLRRQLQEIERYSRLKISSWDNKRNVAWKPYSQENGIGVKRSVVRFDRCLVVRSKSLASNRIQSVVEAVDLKRGRRSFAIVDHNTYKALPTRSRVMHWEKCTRSLCARAPTCVKSVHVQTYFQSLDPRTCTFHILQFSQSSTNFLPLFSTC